MPEPISALAHQVDHITAVQHSGSNEESNLCFCCIRCNLKKGPNIASVDPGASGQPIIVPLYHPRQERWEEHFQLLEDGTMRGLTPQGRATARLLDFNAT